MSVALFFPYSIVRSNGGITNAFAPLVDTLPAYPDTRGLNLILTQSVGVFSPGAYQWSDTKSRWQFILDYQLICQQLFALSDAFLYVANPGDNLIPIGNSGAALLSVYKNGYKTTAFSSTAAGISLNQPATNGDMYLVSRVSPITPTSAISGIGDAPVDSKVYVRSNAAWQDIQSSLNEGAFVGH
ncbi:hypothetical protein H1O16_gp274 [Burkholderia phage BcepSaruman]|uniref:Uncharacterized protein n=1 Tax=Burkholderia phage BcepSaruman TaxID=2530032 RepID=A0A4D5ZEJ0_9CAUD|nr:hypothetical protein H1O16_gp274 [Burkholderia phage BcepSaruman]QBX06687.1 hypothetical protein BcepSaruman_274 [Burkholderia phage BcepSaruman]